MNHRPPKRVLYLSVSLSLLVVALGTIVVLMAPSPSNDPPGPLGFVRFAWETDALPSSLQTGRAVASSSADLDLDGKEETVVAGVYASGLGDIEVLRIENGSVTRLAYQLWDDPAPWQFESLVLLDLDDDGRLEIVVGGRVFLDGTTGNPGLVVFRYQSGSLEAVADDWWGAGQLSGSLSGLHAFSNLSGNASLFVSFSFEVWASGPPRSIIRIWEWNESGKTVTVLRAYEVDSRTKSMAPFPCGPEGTPTRGFLLLGDLAVEMVTLGSNWTLSTTFFLDTPGVYWHRVGCSASANLSLYVGMGVAQTKIDPSILFFALDTSNSTTVVRRHQETSIGAFFSEAPSLYNFATPSVIIQEGRATARVGGTYITGNDFRTLVYSFQISHELGFGSLGTEPTRIDDFALYGFGTCRACAEASKASQILLGTSGDDPALLLDVRGLPTW